MISIGDTLTAKAHPNWSMLITHITPIKCGLLIKGTIPDVDNQGSCLIPFEGCPIKDQVSNGWSIGSITLPNGQEIGFAARWHYECHKMANLGVAQFYEQQWAECPPVFQSVTSLNRSGEVL